MDEAEYQMAKLEEKDQQNERLSRKLMAYGLFLMAFYTLMTSAALIFKGEFGHTVSVSGILIMILIAYPANKLFRLMISLPVATAAIISMLFLSKWLWETIAYAPLSAEVDIFNHESVMAYLFLFVAAEVAGYAVRNTLKVPLETLASMPVIKNKEE